MLLVISTKKFGLKDFFLKLKFHSVLDKVSNKYIFLTQKLGFGRVAVITALDTISWSIFRSTLVWVKIVSGLNTFIIFSISLIILISGTLSSELSG